MLSRALSGRHASAGNGGSAPAGTAPRFQLLDPLRGIAVSRGPDPKTHGERRRPTSSSVRVHSLEGVRGPAPARDKSAEGVTSGSGRFEHIAAIRASTPSRVLAGRPARCPARVWPYQY